MQYSDYVQKMAADQAFSANYDQRVLGMAPPPYKQILQAVAAALAGSLNPTSLVQYAGQGSSNQLITTSGFGTCTAASTDTPTLTALLTSQALDSYLWPIGYGPADPLGGKMRQMDTSPPGSTAHNNLVLGHVEARVGAASHVAGFEVGPGLRIAPYGKRIATNPNDATQSKVAPGAVDSVVSRPLIELSLSRGLLIDTTPAGGADGAGQTAPNPAWGAIPIVEPDGSMVKADGTAYSGPFGWPGLDSASVAAAHSWLIGGARSGSTGGFLSPNIGQRDYAGIITTTRTGPSGLMFGSAAGKTDGNQIMVAVDGTSITVDPDTGLLTAGSGATSGAGSAYSPGLAIEFTRAADSDAPASALTPTVQTGTALGIGAYKVYQSYLDANSAETKLSPVATFTTTSGNQQAQYAVPSSPGAQTITGINLYRTKVGGTTTYFLTSIAVSAGVYSGGNYVDTTADSALGAAYVQKTLIQSHLAYSDSARTIPANGLARDAGFDKKGLAINLAGTTATVGGVPAFLNNSGLSITLPDGAGQNNGLGIVPHTTIGGTPDNGLVIDTFGVGIRQATTATSLIVDSRDTLKVRNDDKTIHTNSSNKEEVLGVLSPNGNTAPSGTRGNPFGCGAQTWQSTGDGVAAVPTPPTSGSSGSGGLTNSPTTPPGTSYPATTSASPPGPGYNCAGNAPVTESYSALTFAYADVAANSIVISSGFAERVQTTVTDTPLVNHLTVPLGPAGAGGQGAWFQCKIKVGALDSGNFPGAYYQMRMQNGDGELQYVPATNTWFVSSGFLSGGGHNSPLQPGATAYLAFYRDCVGDAHMLIGSSASSFTEVFLSGAKVSAASTDVEFGGVHMVPATNTGASPIITAATISQIYVSDGVPPGTIIANFDGSGNTFSGVPGSMDYTGH